MSNYVIFALLGMGSGAVLGMLAIGVLLGYRGSGVVNFSQGAIAMYVAYVWYQLKTTGIYMLPVPGLPSGIQVGDSTGANTAVSLILSLFTAAALGLILHFLILRPLRTAPMLARVVATIGYMLLLQAVVGYRFGTTTVSVPKLLPDTGTVEVLGAQIGIDQFVLAAISIVLAVVLAAFFRYTRFGLATRASAENEQGAILLGFSPDFQAGVNWVMASVLAGVAGILIGPLTQLTPTAFSLLIIPALAAALLGRFTSFIITAVAAILIGMTQGLLVELPSKLSWFPAVGAQDALPFIVIIIAIVFVGKSIPTRDMSLEARLPSAPPPGRIGVYSGAAFFVILGLLFLVMGSGLRVAAINSIIAALVCLSLVVLTGYVGQISLFQLAMAGVAAYMVAYLATKVGIPFPFAPIIAALVASVVGVIAATPALRVRGVNLAIITLAGGYAIETFFFNNPKYTGGSSGAKVPQPEIFGFNLGFVQGAVVGTPQFGIMCVVVLAVSALGVANLRRRQTGLRMLAMRANERSAAASGINIASTKFMAFGFSAFLAGLAGCLMAYQQTQVSGPFDALSSVGILAIAYVGGITSISGSLAAGAIAAGGLSFYVYESYIYADNAVVIFNLIAGLGLILTAIFNPEGISGATRDGARAVDRLVRGRFAKPSNAVPTDGATDQSEEDAPSALEVPADSTAESYASKHMAKPQPHSGGVR
ncbi:ABC transporter [Gordonia sp. HNM0687]|uniref:ABC transporter n=1 Tax=Gordonia mangrovi TaxID=2665643 RepID=A0A6L7GW07_9ACTN|nr:ABC transporter permease [Gordonia mangrovi]MXP24169.1 ABC transporter [Gordonia mangrovi]UVF76939.1 ABC transporter permease [Gordonia mangrovi]